MAAPAEEPGLSYLQGCPDGFLALADVRLEVAGHELPCHSQILARHCKVFSDMLSALAEEKPPPTAKRGRASSGAAFSPAAPVRLEEAFQGTRLQHAELFLCGLYSPERAGALVSSLELQEAAAFQAVFDLANRFDCGLLLEALTAHLAADAAEPMLKGDLLDWIAFADRWAPGFGPLAARWC